MCNWRLTLRLWNLIFGLLGLFPVVMCSQECNCEGHTPTRMTTSQLRMGTMNIEALASSALTIWRNNLYKETVCCVHTVSLLNHYSGVSQSLANIILIKCLTRLLQGQTGSEYYTSRCHHDSHPPWATLKLSEMPLVFGWFHCEFCHPWAWDAPLTSYYFN